MCAGSSRGAPTMLSRRGARDEGAAAAASYSRRASARTRRERSVDNWKQMERNAFCGAARVETDGACARRWLWFGLAHGLTRAHASLSLRGVAVDARSSDEAAAVKSPP
mmetsp:Transcript_33812/g.104704  ORF Transcript_33812/g.104704 Transcript_33812/m.104704 type:complete len:109 (-) Transcript_33812:2-328(-)